MRGVPSKTAVGDAPGPIDFATIDPVVMRASMAVVSQEASLFNRSIAYNIGYPDAQPDAARIQESARIACFSQIVEKAPQGYETRVGERGIMLSGGERQRLAIARAIYKRPAILILDEATSALDTSTERKLMDNLKDSFARSPPMSTIWIAHRLSTIQDAKIIYVLDKGQLIEQGTHEQLMEKKGKYWRLWQDQQRETVVRGGEDLQEAATVPAKNVEAKKPRGGCCSA